MPEAQNQDSSNITFLRNPYREWVEREGVPLISGFAVNLIESEVSVWPRFDARGAVINVAGRGDFLDLWLLEVPSEGATNPQHHLFEVVVYVVEGRGSTSIETSAGTRTFEWGPRSMFVIPLNATYRFFNSSGAQAARLAMTTNFPVLMNLFHDESFIFNTGHEFTSRLATMDQFAGTGLPAQDIMDHRERNFWMTNFVPDLGGFSDLKPLEFRGRASNSIMFLLADGVLHAHMSEIPTGEYKKAHRHMGGTHIYPVDGRGYSLLWYEGEAERRRVDWTHGWVYSPPDNMYHQHFNLAGQPSRYFAVKMGNYRYPFTDRMTQQFSASSADVRKARNQIEYEDEDPDIRALYSEELAKAHSQPRGR